MSNQSNKILIHDHRNLYDYRPSIQLVDFSILVNGNPWTGNYYNINELINNISEIVRNRTTSKKPIFEVNINCKDIDTDKIIPFYKEAKDGLETISRFLPGWS